MAPWEWENSSELEAQTGLQEIQFPLPRDEHVVVGRDQAGELAAVCWWIELGGPARVKLLAAGVSLSHRGARPRIGDLLMAEVLDRLIARAETFDIRVVGAYGLVRPDNVSSQEMLSRAGFYYVMDHGPFQEWWGRLEVTSDDGL